MTNMLCNIIGECTPLTWITLEEVLSIGVLLLTILFLASLIYILYLQNKIRQLENQNEKD